MKLNLNQTQTQTVLPRIIQTMEILQMSTLELHEHIENLLLENPVLEREENYNEGDGSQLLQKLEWLAANQRHYSLREDETKNYIENIEDITNESLYDYLRSQIPWKQYSPAMCRAIECVLSGLDDNGWLEETTEELALRGCVSQNTIHQAE